MQPSYHLNLVENCDALRRQRAEAGTLGPRVWAFDVDHTLECSDGPVPLSALEELRAAGDVVGICGNLTAFCCRVPDWPRRVSFLMGYDFGPWAGGLLAKELYLASFSRVNFPLALEYVMVGNLGSEGRSADAEAAAKAGWRFIREDDFAKGVR